MTRRLRRPSGPAPHPLQPDLDTPDTCARCHLVAGHRCHTEPPTTDPVVTEIERRRTGEREED